MNYDTVNHILTKISSRIISLLTFVTKIAYEDSAFMSIDRSKQQLKELKDEHTVSVNRLWSIYLCVIM